MCRAQRARRDRVATASRPTSLQRVARLLLITRGTSMKDSNDNATLDWVDEVELTENERKFLENREARDTCANLFTLARNLPHSVALNNLIDRTINDLLTKEQ